MYTYLFIYICACVFVCTPLCVCLCVCAAPKHPATVWSGGGPAGRTGCIGHGVSGGRLGHHHTGIIVITLLSSGHLAVLTAFSPGDESSHCHHAFKLLLLDSVDCSFTRQ